MSINVFELFSYKQYFSVSLDGMYIVVFKYLGNLANLGRELKEKAWVQYLDRIWY